MSSLLTLQADTTYLVSGPVICNGGAVIEGGTVVKYTIARTSPSITINGSLTFKTGMYRPAIFTAVDDDSIGDSMTNISNAYYTGHISPNYYASPALVLPASFNASCLRFCYAKTALEVNDTTTSTGTLAHSQFVHCQTGLLVNGNGGGGGVNYNIENCLFTSVLVPFSAAGPVSSGGSSPSPNIVQANVKGGGGSGSSSFNPTISLYNTTIDLAPQLGSMTGNGYLFLAAYNSIFADVTNLTAGGNPSEDGYLELSGTFGVAPTYAYSMPFQTVGAGNYYLNSAYGFQTAGLTNNLPASLIAALALRTTYPPQVVMENTEPPVSGTLNPFVDRDTGVQSLGYHYDPLDYAFGGVYLLESDIALTNGVAVATFGTNGSFYGLRIGSDSTFTSFGAPNHPDWLALYNTVMEGTNNWSRPANSVTAELDGTPQPPAIYTRFTSWSVPANDVPQFYAPANIGPICFQDNEFHGGGLISDAPTIDLTNCLLERVDANLTSTDDNSPWIQNCTFRGGTFNFAPNVSTATVEDNLFDTTNIPNNSITYGGGYNAYISSIFQLWPAAPGGQTLTASPAYQTGTLGQYYLPPGSALIRAGNPTANLLGLYEYTTQTNQVKETNTLVDIGYHYVATDAYGNPLDTLWYGIPDYLADANGSAGLEAWEMDYFGQLGLNPVASEDGYGTTLLEDFKNGVYPNDVSFTLASTNDYFRMSGAVNCYFLSPGASVQLNLSSGIPGYIAVSVDDTNYVNDAIWQPYEGTNISVNLGTTQGWHDVWVGLQGPATNAQVTWEWRRLKLDSTLPLLVVTNPIIGTVSVPIIQLQGYSPKALSQISYNLDNALGEVTNQPVSVTSQFYSTNSGEYLTNSFQAFDIPLTNGVNTITLNATDLAVNVMTTNLSFTLNYAGKPAPVVQLYWPQNGTLICNSSYTWRGWVSDPTATVSAQVTDATGNTSVLTGLVERDGNFWVEDIPMINGVNSLILTVTDAAGNVTTTNITVSPETVDLTIDAPSSDELWNQTLTVTGTIGDSSDYTVWINGVEATLNGDGTWTADNVYLTTDGTAVFQARAIPNSDNGGMGSGGSGGTSVTEAALGNPTSPQASDAEDQIDKPARLFISLYNDNEFGSEANKGTYTPGNETYSDLQEGYQDGIWLDNNGGDSYWFWQRNDESTGGDLTDWDSTYVIFNTTAWPNITILSDNTTTDSGDQHINPIMEHCAINQPVFDTSGSCTLLPDEYNPWTLHETEKDTEHRNAQSTITLQTGGKGTSQNQALFEFTASANQVFCVSDPIPLATPPPPTPPTQIPVQEIQIRGKSLGSDGNLWITLPNNQSIDVTPQINGVDYYTFSESAKKYRLWVAANSSPIQPDRVVKSANFCVGQSLGFSPLWKPSAPPFSYAQAIWTLPGTFVNYQPYPLTCPTFYGENASLLTLNSSIEPALTTYCWYVQALQGGIASVTMNMTFANGQKVSMAPAGQLNVYRPSVTSPLQVLDYGKNAVYPGPLPGTTALGLQPPYGTPILYSAYIQSTFDGTGQFVQLLNGSISGALENFSTGGTEELDGADPYLYETYHIPPGGVGRPWPIPLGDQPWCTCWNSPTIQNWAFTDYLQFTPDAGGPLPNIFVTLATVTWNEYGKANLINGAWTLDPSSSVMGPTGPVDSYAFPLWQQVMAP